MAVLNITTPVPPCSPEQIALAQSHIRNASKMTIHDFQFSTGALLIIAFATFIGRIIIRLLSTQRLGLDDAFLAVAFACLVGPVGILKMLDLLYLEGGILRRDPEALLIAYAYKDQLFHQSAWHIAFYAPLWTAIFAVKGSYFALFYPLLKVTSKRFKIFYWAGVALTIASWAALAFVEQLVICHHMGPDSAKCYADPAALSRKMTALTWVCTILDCVTDLIVINMPIAFLQKTRLPTLTKLGLGCFLCLSVCMLLCAVVRCVVIKLSHVAFDLPLPYWWLYTEACIAVIMGSLTVYRSALVGPHNIIDGLQGYIKRRRGRPSARGRAFEISEGSTGPGPRVRGLKLPGGTMTGIRTMFGLGGSTVHVENVEDTKSDVTEYHVYLKEERNQAV